MNPNASHPQARPALMQTSGHLQASDEQQGGLILEHRPQHQAQLMSNNPQMIGQDQTQFAGSQPLISLYSSSSPLPELRKSSNSIVKQRTAQSMSPLQSQTSQLMACSPCTNQSTSESSGFLESQQQASVKLDHEPPKGAHIKLEIDANNSNSNQTQQQAPQMSPAFGWMRNPSGE